MASLRLSVLCDEVKDPDHWMEHILDSVSVRSATRGRIRFHLGFIADEVLTDTLRREIQKLDSAKLEAYSTRTRNALVTFDANQVSDLEVGTALLRGVKEYIRLHGECDLEHHHHDRGRPGAGHDSGEEECDHDHSATSTDAGIRKELLKLAATGAALGYFVYRKIKGKPVAFEGNPLLDFASLFTIASGYKIFRDGVRSVQVNRKATDDTLVSLAVVATLLMGESLTGLSVVWLINLGRLLEAVTLKRSRTAIKELMDIAPKEAWLVSQGHARKTDVERIVKGGIIRVFHSEKVPLDGKVIRGSALAKEAFITGEALPREKAVGDSVYAGSLLERGEIDIEVTNLVHDTVVARMIDAIENVRDTKAPIERIGTQFASKFIPVSLGLAGATFVFTGDLRRAITMLVIACPCAAGLATPTAVSAAIGQAARKGILIKGGTHVETAARIDTVVFDKTGTLTVGAPEVHDFIEGPSLGPSRMEDALRIAASAEQYTTHPLGLALVEAAKTRGIQLEPVNSHKTFPGLGIEASVGTQTVWIGNARLLETQGIEIPDLLRTRSLQACIPGESLVYLAVERVVLGAFIVQDRLRPESAETLARLRALGIRRILLASGDQRRATEHIGKALGLEEIHAELLPHEKLALIQRLKAEGCKVAMVGDGINDAQALADADLSIAMGGGRCDLAIETSDVTLARNDLLLVAEVLDLSQKTLRAIYQNFVAAVGINAGGLVLSASGKLTPFSAAIVHNASTIAVVLNSLRLGREVAGSNPLKTLEEIRI